MAAAPAVLSVVVPGLGELFSAGRAATEATVATGTIPGDSLGPLQSTVTRQLIEVLLAEARDGAPLLLLIDDMQLCDAASLELLHLLLPRLAGEPLSLVLSIGSYTSSTANGAAVEKALAMWERQHSLLVARHMVPPLPDWAVGELVQARLQARGVPAGFAEQVFSVTKGRPVFVDQCLKLWHPGYGSDVPLPEELPAAVRERFERIDPEARELLILGATVGEYFFSHTLAEVTGLPQTRVQDVLHRVERDHGLVRERRRAGMPRWTRDLYIDWYDFDHRALQSCIRNDQQTEGARILRHARIAEALHRLPRAVDGLPREICALIAEQLREAGPACAAASAAAHYDLARSVALDEMSFAQAEKYCQIAIDSASQLPEGAPERDRRFVEAAELLLSLTEVRWKGYATEPDTGIDALAAEAEEAASRLGDRSLIARTALMRGKTLLAVRGLDPSLVKLEEAVTLARQCGPEGVEVLFVALVEYGRQLPKLDLHAGLQVLREAEELYASAPQLGDAANPVLQHARNLNEMQIGVNLFDAGRFSQALRRLQRCVDRLSGDALRAELAIALNYLAQLHIALGDDAEAESTLLRALQFEEREEGRRQSPVPSVESGTISGWHAYNSALLAVILSRDPSRAGEALQRAAQAWAETQETWLVNLVPIVRNLYVEVLIAAGRDNRLPLQLINDTLVETETSGMARSRIAAYCLRIRLRLSDGDVSSAADDARAALAVLEDRGPMPALRTEEVLYDASRALAAVGEVAEAAALLERARAEVARKADSIEDPLRRERFLTVVPLNRALFPNGRSSTTTATGTVPEQDDSRSVE